MRLSGDDGTRGAMMRLSQPQPVTSFFVMRLLSIGIFTLRSREFFISLTVGTLSRKMDVPANQNDGERRYGQRDAAART